MPSLRGARSLDAALVAVVVALLLWAQLVAPNLASTSFASLFLYQSPYRGPLPGGAATPSGLASRVVIVVSDGLRLDNSREMATLNRLRDRGADRVVRVGLPSYSLPGWTAIGTGAWQEQSGFASNYPTDAIRIDTIFLAARRAGLRTAIVGEKGWDQLYAGGADVMRTFPDPPGHYSDLAAIQDDDARIAAAALDVLRTRPALTLIHLPGTDLSSHGWGGASPEARAVGQEIDGEIAKIVAAIDADTAILVTSDHGHIDRGGHGGDEDAVMHVPLVAAGKGIRPGRYGEALQVDIAPTVAALLGTGMPAHVQGDVLADMLDGPALTIAAREVDDAMAVHARYAAMLAVIDAPSGPAAAAVGLPRAPAATLDSLTLDAARGAARQGNADAALALARQANDDARATWAADRAAHLAVQRLDRAPIVLVLALPFALFVWYWRRRRWGWRVPVAAAAVYAALWYGNFFLVRGLALSPSDVNTEENLRPFLTTRGMEAMAALVAAMVVVGLARRRAGAGAVLRDAVLATFVVAAALGAQILLFYLVWGATFGWYLPDLTFGFAYYMDLVQSTAFWPLPYAPLGAVLPFVALLAARLAARVERAVVARRAAPAPA